MDTQEPRQRRGYWTKAALGLALMAVGVVFLLRNLGYELPFLRYHNWWALFILLGAVGPLSVAAERYRTTGRAGWIVLHSLLSAGAIVMVAAFFLVDLDWTTWWPLFVIYGGFWMLLKDARRRDTA